MIAPARRLEPVLRPPPATGAGRGDAGAIDGGSWVTIPGRHWRRSAARRLRICGRRFAMRGITRTWLIISGHFSASKNARHAEVRCCHTHANTLNYESRRKDWLHYHAIINS